MAVERIHRPVTGSLKVEDFEELEKAGWRPVSIEWEREKSAGVTPSATDPIPFGLRVAQNCQTLEPEPQESAILVAMMELLIQDGPYSGIAQELNRRGYLTREGTKWTPVAIFQMLPRLIEAGPSIFSSSEWERRKHADTEHKK